MTKKSNNKSWSELLHQKAEQLLKDGLDSPSTHQPVGSLDSETLKLIQEIEVHQLELEMQNEELRLSLEAEKIAVDKYTELYDFAPSGHFTLSTTGEILEVNLFGSKMLGKERSRIKKSQFGFIVSDDTKPDFNFFLERIFTSKVKESCELTLSITGNLPIVVQLAGIINKNGEQCLVSMVDITGRKLAEEALKETNAYLENLINYANVPIIVWDPLFCITRFNHAFELLTGRSESEVHGQSLEILFPPAIVENSMALIRKTLTGERMETVEIEILNRDGAIQTVLWNSATIFASDGHTPIATIAQGHNITERKKVQIELEKFTLALQESIAEKDKFFSVIAHDLRAPFNGFLGFTNILVEDLDTLTLKEIQKIAVSMKNSATNIFRLLENLLEWSQIQRGISSFEPASFLLLPLMDESLRLVLDSSDKKEIEIIFNIEKDLKVFADENMLGSTIRNLVTNAVKFTPRGGKITIAAKPASADSVEISISDTGIGMSREMIEDLFRIDVQTSRRGTENEPSTGLGLIICKEFIEKHGGKIWVESEEEKGSTFWFTLPANLP